MRTLVLVAVLLAGCAQPPDPLAAQKAAYRREAFKDCMTALPAGPVSTQYNDWSEVVARCDTVSYYQMNTRFK